MGTLTNVVLTISCLTWPLYFCIPKPQRTQYFSPTSRAVRLMDNLGFFACVVLIVRLIIGYEWASLDRILFLIPITAMTIHNVSMYLSAKLFAGARSDAPVKHGR